MKKKLTLWVDDTIVLDFRDAGGGTISQFLQQKMAEYIEQMRLQWWIYCPKCSKKSHIRIIFNKNGCCPFDDCGERIAEKIEPLKN